MRATMFCLIFLVTKVIVSRVFSPPVFQKQIKDERKSQISLAFSICKQIAIRTEVRLFYTVEIHSNPLSTQLIRNLHEASIQTIATTHYSKSSSTVVTEQSKNIIFVLKDIQELFDLLFCTISQPKSAKLNEEKVSGPEIDGRGTGHQMEKILPRYCIKIDNRSLTPEKGKTCFKTVSITSTELEDSSTLSDEVFHATRGLYFNKIWNFKNHLIIFLTNFGLGPRKSSSNFFQNKTLKSVELDTSSNLHFCFRFFWRFFKSQKTVICHLRGCEKYDPFMENLISYSGDADETFFDFSWKNMRGKPVGTSRQGIEDEVFNVAHGPTWILHNDFITNLLESLETIVNCTIKDYYDYHDAPPLEIDEGLKYDIDLFSFGTGIISADTDFSKFDFSISIGCGSLCIATPHSVFMSQGLVIFKSFTPVAWAFISITIVIFVLVQYIFQQMQSGFFYRLYTDAEIDNYRDTSSWLTVYAYFICGSPPSLQLGHLSTGKIIFIIFSFSAIIISTVFLSGMTTLLSSRVVYPEIDAINTLVSSDLFIQSFEVLNTGDMYDVFDQLNQSEVLKSKLLDSFKFDYDSIVESTFSDNFSFFGRDGDELFKSEKALGNRLHEAVENVRSLATTDAFLISLPFSSTPRKSLRIRHFNRTQWFEYHLMEECLITYPLIFPFLKQSFFFEILKQMVARYIEGGLVERILERMLRDELRLELPGTMENGEPRAFGLNDLQSAFIGLAIGLFLSFLVFVGEMLTDFFQLSVTVKFKKILECSLIKKVRSGVTLLEESLSGIFR
ncbi:unnamed protein product [Bemisia tabaci]|uniref:Ionotropic receptor n=1 Tax=Bemisia tabaci TaxID=7038 RepID=A0A9P0A0X7_BEMTA|nr:unnamed protein product [Bemisia tabaci]